MIALGIMMSSGLAFGLMCIVIGVPRWDHKDPPGYFVSEWVSEGVYGGKPIPEVFWYLRNALELFMVGGLFLMIALLIQFFSVHPLSVGKRTLRIPGPVKVLGLVLL